MPVESEATINKALRRILRQWGIVGVDLAALRAALSAGDEARVVSLLGVSTEALSPLLERLTLAYSQQGQKLLNELPRGVVGELRFGLANPSALDYLSRKSSELIQDLVDEQRDVVRLVLTNVYRSGQNPRAAIRLLAGKRNNLGIRTGSVIGQSRLFAEHVIRAREELFDPRLIGNYLTRKRRDSSLDWIVNRAIKEGRPLKVEEVERLTARYNDRLLDLRAEVIARTEFHEATETARWNAARSLVDSGKHEEEAVEKWWDSTGDDGHTRATHLAMEGQKRKLNEPFESPRGARLMFPGDRSLGAPIHETAMCRCVMRIRVNRYRGLK